MTQNDWRMIPAQPTTTIGDFRRYPGARVVLACTACSWAKGYDPEKIIDRLRDLRAGGNTTRLADVLKRVGWNCPRCSRMRWRMAFAWPSGMLPADIKRLAERYRN